MTPKIISSSVLQEPHPLIDPHHFPLHTSICSQFALYSGLLFNSFQVLAETLCQKAAIPNSLHDFLIIPYDPIIPGMISMQE